MASTLVCGTDRKAHVVDVPLSSPGPTDLVVQVSVAAMSYGPMRSPGRLSSYGTEFCGTVIEVGASVTSLEVGQLVVGVTRQGACATELVVPSMGVFPIDPTASDSHVVIAVASGLAAVFGMEAAQLQPGDSVVVLDARGGTSCFLAGLCRSAGFRAVATCSEPQFVDALLASGFESVLAGPVFPPAAVLVAANGGRRADALFDCSRERERTWSEISTYLVPGGRAVRTRYERGREPGDWPPGQGSCVNVIAKVAQDIKRPEGLVGDLVAKLDSGELVVPTLEFGLTDGPQAVELSERGMFVGRILIRP